MLVLLVNYSLIICALWVDSDHYNSISSKEVSLNPKIVRGRFGGINLKGIIFTQCNQ